MMLKNFTVSIDNLYSSLIGSLSTGVGEEILYL